MYLFGNIEVGVYLFGRYGGGVYLFFTILRFFFQEGISSISARTQKVHRTTRHAGDTLGSGCSDDLSYMLMIHIFPDGVHT